jgi:hypothetical protein
MSACTQTRCPEKLTRSRWYEAADVCTDKNLQILELVLAHYFLDKTTKNRLELAKDLG